MAKWRAANGTDHVRPTTTTTTSSFSRMQKPKKYKKNTVPYLLRFEIAFDGKELCPEIKGNLRTLAKNIRQDS